MSPAHIAAGDEQAADAELDRLVSGGAPKGFVSLVGRGSRRPGPPHPQGAAGLAAGRRHATTTTSSRQRCWNFPGATRSASTSASAAPSPGTRQADINARLLADAQRGLRVARLKGGDPFIFGRGGEEIETLRQHGIEFEVIPGITAALGCAAYAGIPLTHRDWAQSVRFVTGHLRDDVVRPQLGRNWRSRTRRLVVYMGLAGLRQLSARLIEHGMDPDTPSATISRGTLEDQAVVAAPISGLAHAVEQADVPGPTTTIIGRVVDLRAEFGGAR